MKLRMGDRELGYEVAGDGPALVLLHAFPFDRRMWRANVAPLARARRMIIAVDFRGFGESELGPDPFKIEDLADDVAALLDELSLPKAALLGLSLGGYVALAFAERHFSRLSALILADTRAGADGAEAKRGRDEAISHVRREPDAYTGALLDRLLATAASEDLRTELRTLADRKPAALEAALVAMRDRPDRTAVLEEIRCPTLIVVGWEDRVTPPAEARAMQRAVPGSRLVEITGAGHLSNLEQPDRFNGDVSRFLDELSLF